jgi:hypothetical protein
MGPRWTRSSALYGNSRQSPRPNNTDEVIDNHDGWSTPTRLAEQALPSEQVERQPLTTREAEQALPSEQRPRRS